ncbi:SCO2584 family spore wall biosynthesis protein [Streptomyces sp. BR1]|uniref:SCO2584 family spore wall biosynthesis protein n=1 Tax=Streptomyces sp. BR1 TaxID=1592323 RepID=UPI00402BD679
MPDDVGGRPFPDGWEPDDDRGGADDAFASVVFDEDFVRAAEIHEPSAVERLLAAAQARAEADAARARAGSGADDDFTYPARDPDAFGPAFPGGAEAGPYGPHGGALRPYRGRSRWHRPVAWLLALIMGVGMIALAFAAVYRGASAGHDDPAPLPTTSNVDKPDGKPGLPIPAAVGPTASADYSAPAAPAAPAARAASAVPPAAVPTASAVPRTP